MNAASGPSDPAKAFAGYAAAVSNALRELVARSEDRRVHAGDNARLTQEELDGYVNGIIASLPAYESGQDVTRTCLEKTLENIILELPSLVDRSDDAAHLSIYFDLLDVATVFVNRQLVEAQLAFSIIESLMESLSVQDAEALFAYLESRRDSLTKDMVPGKGKALVILRTLNDLLRRLSKSTHTVFCGRILLFLAQIFPLGERSGVNLRGEFNKENVTTFEDVETTITLPLEKIEDDAAPLQADAEIVEVEGADKDNKAESLGEAPEDGEEVEEGAMAIDEPVKSTGSATDAAAAGDKDRGEQEPRFYTLFWSLQSFFADPQSLLQNGSPHNALPEVVTKYGESVQTAAMDHKVKDRDSKIPVPETTNLGILQQGVSRVLTLFAEASKKEKALQGAAKDPSNRNIGSKSLTDAKTATKADIKKMFFYPKYLTSQSLLDLQIADSNFRKQVLVQFLILFQYLHTFTEANKVKLAATLKTPNRSVQPPLRLQESDNDWIKDLEARTVVELGRTPPDGEAFCRTVRAILLGERNWSYWKANACQLFEKPPLGKEAVDAARTSRDRLSRILPKYPYKAGTAALSKLWESAGIDSDDKLETRQKSARTLESLFDQLRNQTSLIAFRKEELADDGITDAVGLASDIELQRLEERKASLSWRALRLVSATHLHLFQKMGVRNIENLMDAIDKEKAAAAKAAETTVDTTADFSTIAKRDFDEKPLIEANVKPEDSADVPIPAAAEEPSLQSSVLPDDDDHDELKPALDTPASTQSSNSTPTADALVAESVDGGDDVAVSDALVRQRTESQRDGTPSTKRSRSIDVMDVDDHDSKKMKVDGSASASPVAEQVTGP